MKYTPPIGAASPDDPYIDGSPSTGVEGSAVPAAPFNELQLEIQHVIEQAGLTPDHSNTTQLYEALLSLAPNPFSTGMMMQHTLTAAPAGWVFASGKTIGDAASGATNRAHPDTLDLFTALWNAFNNTMLPLQDAAGNPVARGANALADYNAHRRLPTPDLRGRVAAGLDNMGGTAANRLTGLSGGVAGATLGSAGGAEAQTISNANMTPHNHKYNDQGYKAYYDLGSGYAATTVDGVAVSASTTGLKNASTNGSTMSTTVASEGGGGAHNNVQPTFITNFIIKL